MVIATNLFISETSELQSTFVKKHTESTCHYSRLGRLQTGSVVGKKREGEDRKSQAVKSFSTLNYLPLTHHIFFSPFLTKPALQERSVVFMVFYKRNLLQLHFLGKFPHEQ
ncbi:unnamed protein product [Caretta caretta]